MHSSFDIHPLENISPSWTKNPAPSRPTPYLSREPERGETRNYFIFFFFRTQVNYFLSVLLLCSLNPDLPSFNASKALFNNSCYTFLLCIKSNSLLSVQQMNYDTTCSSNVRLQLKHDALHLRGSQWKPVWL